MKIKTYCAVLLSVVLQWAYAEVPSDTKPRVLVSTDIGGTDPDDNQSMIHLLMYSDMFDIEGLVSSPSFGEGSKTEILKMIDLYEQDFPKLKAHSPAFMHPDSLRALCKQGHKGMFALNGYGEPTEGSEWIVKCARKKDERPLWILVWGTLEDVAQALYDAPDIVPKIRVYWIGGPNKKWGVNSYCYIADAFPDLWMIENNASYRGFIADDKKDDIFNRQYYACCIEGAGAMGADFKTYYNGSIKMGDSPSLFYLMNGNPMQSAGESWGGSFVKTTFSPRTVFRRHTSLLDTVAIYSVIEFRFKGQTVDRDTDKPCFTLHIDNQSWDGYYAGNGEYVARYSPKAPAVLSYTISSEITELNGGAGKFVVDSLWPGKPTEGSYPLGDNWYTDKDEPVLFEGKWQGAKTVEKWRNDVLADWSNRWAWLRNAR